MACHGLEASGPRSATAARPRRAAPASRRTNRKSRAHRIGRDRTPRAMRWTPSRLDRPAPRKPRARRKPPEESPENLTREVNPGRDSRARLRPGPLPAPGRDPRAPSRFERVGNSPVRDACERGEAPRARVSRVTSSAAARREIDDEPLCVRREISEAQEKGVEKRKARRMRHSGGWCFFLARDLLRRDEQKRRAPPSLPSTSFALEAHYTDLLRVITTRRPRRTPLSTPRSPRAWSRPS